MPSHDLSATIAGRFWSDRPLRTQKSCLTIAHGGTFQIDVVQAVEIGRPEDVGDCTSSNIDAGSAVGCDAPDRALVRIVSDESFEGAIGRKGEHIPGFLIRNKNATRCEGD